MGVRTQVEYKLHVGGVGEGSQFVCLSVQLVYQRESVMMIESGMCTDARCS